MGRWSGWPRSCSPSAGCCSGFFLPGDSLLFTAGLFVANGAIGAPLWAGLPGAGRRRRSSATSCGYYIGRAAGPAIFDKPRSRLFNPAHVLKTQEFFDKYGNRAIVLGRFVPIVRTFITVMAGVGRMEPKRYLTYSLIGGVLWAAGVTLLGFWLGQFAFVRANIELILILIVVDLGAADRGRAGARPPHRAAPPPAEARSGSGSGGPLDAGRGLQQHPGAELHRQVGLRDTRAGLGGRLGPSRRRTPGRRRSRPARPRRRAALASTSRDAAAVSSGRRTAASAR